MQPVSRYGITLGLALLASCASAGPEGAPPDAAPGRPDAAVTPDAPMTPDAPPMNVCPSAATCQTATMLGTVSGDTGNMRLTAMGHQSAWYRVRVSEDDSDIAGFKLRVAARLTSPPGVDFDVFVYLNAGSDVLECATTVGTTTTNGAVNQVRAEWGEGTFSNGSSDDRNVSIEIRPVSGTCAPTSMWQLEVEGNWN